MLRLYYNTERLRLYYNTETQITALTEAECHPSPIRMPPALQHMLRHPIITVAFVRVEGEQERRVSLGGTGGNNSLGVAVAPGEEVHEAGVQVRLCRTSGSTTQLHQYRQISINH